MLLDTHCHVDQFPDPRTIVATCERESVTTVAVTNLPSQYKARAPYVSGSRFVKLALGFHPLVVAQHRSELAEFLRVVPEVDFVGEIGLDFSSDGAPTRILQLEAFRAIAEAVAGTRKFITIHSRGASDAILSILEEFGIRNAVFHWYSGTLSVLDRAVEKGIYFSVNPAMLRSNKGRQIIGRVPRTRILTETDGPYVKIGNRPAEPVDVRRVVEFLAKEWGVSTGHASKTVFENYERIVRYEVSS